MDFEPAVINTGFGLSFDSETDGDGILAAPPMEQHLQ